MDKGSIFEKLGSTFNGNEAIDNLKNLNSRLNKFKILSSPFYLDNLWSSYNKKENFLKQIFTENLKVGIGNKFKDRSKFKELKNLRNDKLKSFNITESLYAGIINNKNFNLFDNKGSRNIQNNKSKDLKSKFRYTSDKDVINFFRNKERKGYKYKDLKKSALIVKSKTGKAGSRDFMLGECQPPINLNPNTDSSLDFSMKTKYFTANTSFSNKKINPEKSDNNILFLTSTRSNTSVYNKSLIKYKNDNLIKLVDDRDYSSSSSKHEENALDKKYKFIKRGVDVKFNKQMKLLDLDNDIKTCLITENNSIIRHNEINTDLFVRSTLVEGPANTKFSKIKISKGTPHTLKNIASKYNQQTFSFKMKTFNSMNKKLEEEKILNKVNKTRLTTSSNILIKKRSTSKISKKDLNIGLTKSSNKIISEIRKDLYGSRFDLNPEKVIQNQFKSKESFKDLSRKASGGWNYQVDQTIKIEGKSEHSKKGLFVYGGKNGFHLDNYDRMYGIEERIGIPSTDNKNLRFLKNKKFKFHE